MMSALASRSFVFSALLHGFVAGLMFVVMIRIRPEPIPEPRVVEVVPDTLLPPEADNPPMETRGLPPAVNFTPVRVIKPVRQEARPSEFVERPRSSERSQRPQPQPPPPTTAVRSGVTSRPATIAEHQRVHPTSTVRNRPMSTVPAINLDQVLAASPSDSTPPVAAIDAAQVASYVERLLARLRAVHGKPAGLDDGLRARIEFVIGQDGSVGDVRILASSGSDVFDASVLAAFRKLGDMGVPPTGVAGKKTVTFRIQAD